MELVQAIRNGRLFFDGGMGSMLQAAGLPEGLLPDIWSIERPQVVQDIHRAYLEAGCNLITTNTFGASVEKLAPYGYTVSQVMEAGVNNARAAMAQTGRNAYVAVDLGPYGKALSSVRGSRF